jgi:protein gp37
MSGRTGISWTDRTWNPVVGCTKVSQGCKNCYAKTIHDRRHAAALAGKDIAPQYAQPFETVQLMYDRLTDPLSWRDRSRVFVNSVSDLFHESVPFEYIDLVFGTMLLASRHTFQILTKRPDRMREYFARLAAHRHNWPPVIQLHQATSEHFFGSKVRRTRKDVVRIDRAAFYGHKHTPWPLKNVWLGVSVENQAAADERITLLLQTPAAIRFLSCEPLLGPIDVSVYLEEDGYIDDEYVRPIDWVIAGGESGSAKQHVRPMHPDWARSLRDQCVTNFVPFHFKQNGDFRPVSQIHADDCDERLNECDDSRVVCVDVGGREWVNNESRCDGQPPSDAWYMERIGTRTSGRLLDGKLWSEYPVVRV